MKLEAGSSIKIMVGETIKQIEEGLPDDYEVTSGGIGFDLNVGTETETGGKVLLKVLSIGTKVSESQTQKIKFYVKKKYKRIAMSGID